MSIWPSLLAADLLNLESQILHLTQHQIQQVHLDIMDNHYVPNLSFSPDVCAAIQKRFPALNIDVHLMTTPVDDLIRSFAKAGAKRIAVHAASTFHLDYSLKLIKQLGCRAGLAINPSEDIEQIKWCHMNLDYLLMMTVNPGFGGQSLIKDVIPKIKMAHELYPYIPIMVDGGVNLKNIQELQKAGTEDFVIGSALFGANNFPNNIQDFQKQVKGV